MKKFTSCIRSKANGLALRARMALSNQRGDFYISDAVKIIIAVVLGALLLDSREAIDRVFATLALAAVAAALLSVLGRMGAGPFPSEYDLRLSLRRDYNMFAVTILLGWSGGAFLLLRQGVSAKNRGILLNLLFER